MSEIVQRPHSPALRAYRFINRPYYWYRPSQVAIRLRSKSDGEGAERLLRTAWGSYLYCWPDALGLAVARTGVYDLIVAETLARLADRGETAVDAGANVGFMTNLLANAVGSSGQVICFEPHPADLADAEQEHRTLEAERRNRSDSRPPGGGFLDQRAPARSPSIPTRSRTTRAPLRWVRALLRASEPARWTPQRSRRSAWTTSFSEPIGVLKLDVEEHELAALQGAESLLSRGLIRDVLFEEHRPPPTPVTELLESSGYTVLGVRQGLIGPVVSGAAEAYSRQLWDPPALLATTDPERVRERLKPRGWVCLRRGFNSYAA